jgi:hypothetical protein
MNGPPGKIKTIIHNVISHLFPSVDISEIWLPEKSYMGSEEMAILSDYQKHDHLSENEDWHLSSDGTTLHQQKKVALLINGLVFGIHDVPEGSSVSMFDALIQSLRS